MQRDRHDHHATGHTAYLAWCGTGPWLLAVRVATPADLLSADLGALARGDRAAVARSLPGARPSEPVLLVCTNGRRDVCCAVRGRPVALEAAAARIPVLRATRCLAGGVAEKAGTPFASAGELTPVKARVEFLLQVLAARRGGGSPG